MQSVDEPPLHVKRMFGICNEWVPRGVMPARWGPTHVGSSRCMMIWAYSLNTCNLDMQFEHVQSGHAIWTGEEGMTHRS